MHLLVMRVELETSRLVLRELEDRDASATNVWESDPAVVRYQSNDVQTLEESVAYLRGVQAESREVPRRLFDLGVVRREDGLLIGRVGIRVGRPEHREAEAWFVLRSDCQRMGYALEAMRALFELGFRTLDLHRIFGDCDPRNGPSARLMEKLGMRREAHLRENWWLKGEWCDSWIYAILDRDWVSFS